MFKLVNEMSISAVHASMARMNLHLALPALHAVLGPSYPSSDKHQRGEMLWIRIAQLIYSCSHHDVTYLSWRHFWVHLIEDYKSIRIVELHINLSLNSGHTSIYQITTKDCTKN